MGGSAVMAMTSTNHKVISNMYFVLGFMGLVLGSVYSFMIRMELGFSSCSILLNWDMYNHAVTLHGILMIFGFVMPVLLGSFANMLLPICLGCAEVAYCRLNNVSLIVYMLGLLYVVLALISERMIGMGWTFYPPLSTTHSFLAGYGVATLLCSLLVMG